MVRLTKKGAFALAAAVLALVGSAGLARGAVVVSWTSTDSPSAGHPAPAPIAVTGITAVPTPGAVALLGLAAVVASGRRR